MLGSLQWIIYFFRARTKQETVIAGLLGEAPPYLMEVVEVHGKGRGVIVKDSVRMGAYVCEYEADSVFPRKQRASREEEYARNEEGCYIIDVHTRDGWVCLDATRSFSAIGRLLNHAPRAVATLTPYKPLFVGGKWRVGFTASRQLHPGEELTWDYGCEPGGLEWLKRRKGCKESV